MNKLAKNLVAAALAAFASSSVLADADSYLYWMVDPYVYNWLDTTHTPIQYSYVMVNFGGVVDEDGNVTDGTWLNPYSGGSPVTKGGEVVDYLPALAASGGPLYWGVIDGTTGSFIFELFNESDKVIGWNTASYQHLLDLNAISDGENPGGTTAYRLSQVVPEPTSGLLSLFGLAMLALRRRRRAQGAA